MCIGGKFTQIWIKYGDLMCQFCACYLNIYNLYMYKHEIIRNWLIGYSTFILANWNLEITDRLTVYLVKTQSTNIHTRTRTLTRTHAGSHTHTHARTHTYYIQAEWAQYGYSPTGSSSSSSAMLPLSPCIAFYSDIHTSNQHDNFHIAKKL